MEKRWLIVIFVAMFVLAAVAASLLVSRVYFGPGTLEECKELKYSGEGKTGIVIFSDEATAEKYMNFFFNVTPFDRNKDEFNFYYIDTYKPNCEIYQGVAVLCYSKELINKAASCPSDYIVVIDKEHETLRSSSYMNVMSINYNSPLSVFVHEFGHAFANFADEYTPSSIPRNSENCVSDCKDFGSETEGCFDGCAKTDYFRSVNLGLMRTLSSESFGLFNEKIISERIAAGFSGVSGKVVSGGRDCTQEKYILVEGIYSNEKMYVVGKSVEQGCIGGNGAGGFDYSIVKEDGSLISGGKFNPELIFTDLQGTDKIDGGAFGSDKSFLLKVPIIENSKSLDISSNGELVAEINLKDVGARPCRI